MRSPEGQEYPNVGCYLEIIENRKLAWTNALAPGFPRCDAIASCGPLAMTAVITLEPHSQGTKYVAWVLHNDAAGRKDG